MFYITTAIDYTNGKPHVGHAYEKVLADVIHRYKQSIGEQSYLLIGVDQHGQKVQQSAEKEGVDPEEYVKRLTEGFIQAWKALGVEYNGWAETTNELHKKCVQRILQKLYKQGDIYKKRYKGFYSIRQEQFLTEKERGEDGEFDEQWGLVEERDEENYYFKLSRYTPWLKEFLSQTDETILPSFRKVDVLNALEKSDEDLCISRPKKRLEWGIELPFDSEFVTFVWFDALVNYISFAGYDKQADEELPDFDSLWPANLHVIGKDILVPSHAIYWPCMLKAMGFENPQMPTLLVHGWWNIKSGEGSEKMSKSLGNVIEPTELVESFGQDAVRYYLVRDIHTGKDSNYDLERLVMLFNTELANNLGNLCNRALNMIKRYCDGKVPSLNYDDESCKELRGTLEPMLTSYHQYMQQYQISFALEEVVAFISKGNVFAEQHKPWELAKEEENKPHVETVLRHMLDVVVISSSLLEPIIPQAVQRIAEQLKIEDFLTKTNQVKWSYLPEGHELAKAKPVFPRIVLTEE